MAELELKQQRLKEELSKVPSLVVAYSGGVDSAYLACAAHQVLGEGMLGVTALSASYSARDRREAEACVRRFHFPHEFIETDELSSAAYRANNPDRCYFCKDELFDKLDELVLRRGYAAVAYGVNVDDQGEEALHALGFSQVRVRYHEKLVRIEIAPEELPRALTPEMARRFVDIFKPLGFSFVTLDLEGYRQGSLNTQLVTLQGQASSS